MIEFDMDHSKKIYCVDLDDTICFPNHEFSDSINKYKKAKPNKKIIDKINFLYDNGCEIIIFTARRMLTHNENIEKILEDVEEITINWLRQNNVQYTRLLFGKPYADHYVDDKSMSLNEFLVE